MSPQNIFLENLLFWKYEIVVSLVRSLYEACLNRITLWRDKDPLILASTSRTRRDLLLGAGFFVDIRPPEISERLVEAVALARGSTPADVALSLAREKALSVSRKEPKRYILGADQILDFDGTVFHKPSDRNAAFAQLSALAGRRHQLHSAFCIVRNGEILHENLATARLAMRPLSSRALELYLRFAAEQALQSPGGYQIENLGVHLFENVEGDHSTILGLPMRLLLNALREMQLLAF